MSRRDDLLTDCRALAVCVGRSELTLTILELLDLEALERLRLALLHEYLDTII